MSSGQYDDVTSGTRTAAVTVIALSVGLPLLALVVGGILACCLYRRHSRRRKEKMAAIAASNATATALMNAKGSEEYYGSGPLMMAGPDPPYGLEPPDHRISEMEALYPNESHRHSFQQADRPVELTAV